MTFVIWGVWYGFFVILEMAGLKRILSRIWRPIRHVYLLLIVILGWVVFRSDSITQAINYLGIMFNLGQFGSDSRDITEFLQKDVLIAILIGAITSCNLAYFYHKGVLKLVKHTKKPQVIFMGYKAITFVVAFSFFIYAVMGLSSNTYNPFIYFRF
jgi:alginate O-acetyltransferase complex protein AlgI